MVRKLMPPSAQKAAIARLDGSLEIQVKEGWEFGQLDGRCWESVSFLGVVNVTNIILP